MFLVSLLRLLFVDGDEVHTGSTTSIIVLAAAGPVGSHMVQRLSPPRLNTAPPILHLQAPFAALICCFLPSLSGRRGSFFIQDILLK